MPERRPFPGTKYRDIKKTGCLGFLFLLQGLFTPSITLTNENLIKITSKSTIGAVYVNVPNFGIITDLPYLNYLDI